MKKRRPIAKPASKDAKAASKNTARDVLLFLGFLLVVLFFVFLARYMGLK